MEQEPNHEEEALMYVECESCGEDFEITPENSKTQIWLVSGYQHLNFIALQHTEEWYSEHPDVEEPDEDAPIDVQSIEWNDVLYDFLTKYQPEPYEFSKRLYYGDARGEL